MNTRKVTLSFDDGPHMDHTPAILDVLAHHGIKSSFFAICSKLEDPELLDVVRGAVAQGHWYGSHSYFHKTPMGWMEDFDDAVPEIDLGFQMLGELAVPHRMYRPFGFGGIQDTRLLNPVAVDHLVKNGLSCVLWDFTPTEWKNTQTWVEACAENCADRDWTCLVLRDSEATIAEQLDRLIVKLKGEGYEFVQEFPAHVMPIREGRIEGDLTEFVAAKVTN